MLKKNRNYNQTSVDQAIKGAGGNERARGRFNQKMKVICQVCGKTGHIALHCYHRFDVYYIGNNRVTSEIGGDETQKTSAAFYTSRTSNPFQSGSKEFQQ